MCLQELRAGVQDWSGGGGQDRWNDVAGGGFTTWTPHLVSPFLPLLS